ncbi:MAG TPA: methenyltetrahydromethanopterin cyclohydrolase [Burkholderiales bacterium]|nr:methenyltetrahydromethanopterin cyclohydrolase [Burkholderiales bacterium]
MASDTSPVSVNHAAAPLVEALVRDALSLRLAVQRLPNGCTLIDAGVSCPGGLQAGQRIAEISLAGLGQVTLIAGSVLSNWPWQVVVHTRNPVLACIASQMAGWRLSDRSKRFEAIGSGPARALVAKEKEFARVHYEDDASIGCLILETDTLPPESVAASIAADCDIDPRKLTLIVSPTQSLSGVVQIAARILSTALLKMQESDLPINCVVDAIGSAPLPPAGGSSELAMGRTNDALLYGGQVHLFIRGNDALAERIAQRVPSRSSKDYGRPFATLIQEAGGFYKMDPALFAPAMVIVTSLDSGRSFHGGQFNATLLEESFGRA